MKKTACLIASLFLFLPLASSLALVSGNQFSPDLIPTNFGCSGNHILNLYRSDGTQWPLPFHSCDVYDNHGYTWGDIFPSGEYHAYELSFFVSSCFSQEPIESNWLSCMQITLGAFVDSTIFNIQDVSPTPTPTIAPTISPSPSPVLITTLSLPSATVGEDYSQAIQTTCGTSPFIWSLSKGKLPTGLILNSSTGQIFGIPTKNGVTKFTVRVIDANGVVAEKVLSITTRSVKR